VGPEPADADPATDPGDPEAVETDSEATVTLRVGPSAAAPSRPAGGTARRPAYGAYGSAADSELPTQMIAPLPFGSQHGRVEQQPARAFRAQPPTAPPLGFQDERPRADRRKRTTAALLVVIGLIVVVGIGGVLLLNGLRDNGGGNRTGANPGGAASVGPATIPAGYAQYDGSGFSVGVPSGWPSQGQRDGVVDVKERNSTRFLRLITVNSTTAAFDQLAAAERQFSADPSYGLYQRVKLQRVNYQGLDAADWEFTFTLDGVPRHVLYRGIVSGGRTYGLYLSTPEDRWAKSKGVFQVAADTFRTS
jgi:hypothetical protein